MMCQALSKHLTHAIRLAGCYLDPILQMSKWRHRVNTLNDIIFQGPLGLLLSIPRPAHRAADQRIAVPSKEQRLGFEEKTGHPFSWGQRDLP